MKDLLAQVRVTLILWFLSFSSLITPCSALRSVDPTTTTRTLAHPPRKFRYRARVAYDGSNFQGFQIQQRREEINWRSRNSDVATDKKQKSKKRVKRTVQGVLESVLCQRLDDDNIKVLGAGRTDAGVHARGQAIHFDCSQNLTLSSSSSSSSLQEMEHSINAMLPDDVRLWSLQEAPPPLSKCINGRNVTKTWSVMYDSTRKLYSYRLNVAPVMSPLQRHWRWHPDRIHVWLPDLERLRSILQLYVGTHDFRAFAGGMERKEREACESDRTVNTVRTVYVANLVGEDDNSEDGPSRADSRSGGDGRSDTGNYRIDFMISGALYKQVRNMVGAALEACRERNMNVDDLRRLLKVYGEDDDDDDKRQWSRKDLRTEPAPPHGLTLEHVYFSDKDDF